MSKKFNLGDEVTMSKSCSDFLLKNAMEIYATPSTGLIAKDHIEELACILWSVHNKQKLCGVVYGVHNESIYVIFENEVGQFSAYYEEHELNKIGDKNGIKRASKKKSASKNKSGRKVL